MGELTPVAIEQKLTSLVSEISRSQKDLAEARDVEAATEAALKRAQVTAFFRDDCPTPARGGLTVADREMWIDRETLDVWEAHRTAVKAREIAVDHVRAVLAQSEVVRSLGASVRTAYNVAGHS